MTSRPRIWPSLVLAVVASVGASLVAGIVAYAGAFAMGWLTLEDLAQPTPPVLLMTTVALTGIVSLGLVLCAASLSPVPIVERLGLTRGVFRPTTMILAGLFSMGLAQMTGTAATLLLGEEAFEILEFMFPLDQVSGWTTVGLFVAISIGPGVYEEILFRGFVQRRLLARTRPWIAITVTSVLFGASHLVPQQMLIIAPTSIWLGVVGWRSKSVLAPIVAHVIHNAGTFVLAKGLPDLEADWSHLGVVLATTTLVGVAMFASEPELRPNQARGARTRTAV
ncbi:MAG: CPBP family intramembrane metalloprotease [Myxococcales bacterium]|nr:CPBP family intramembrane metalloprotease [Myxococcales bacterium]